MTAASEYTVGERKPITERRGPEHPNWNGGINATYYQTVAYGSHGHTCNRCGSDADLMIHHVDRNRHNSELGNLEVLCRTCHMREHHGRRIDWTCPVCGVVISLQPWDARNRRFCSNPCRMQARKFDGTFGGPR